LANAISNREKIFTLICTTEKTGRVTFSDPEHTCPAASQKLRPVILLKDTAIYAQNWSETGSPILRRPLGETLEKKADNYLRAIKRSDSWFVHMPGLEKPWHGFLRPWASKISGTYLWNRQLFDRTETEIVFRNSGTPSQKRYKWYAVITPLRKD
jgi:hypothetical protein